MSTSITWCITFLLLLWRNCHAEKLIIDTDAGGDDGLAILMLLRAETLKESPYEVIGITCTYGNTKEEFVEQNVIAILNFANRTDIPVYGGAKRSLLMGDFRTESIYGRNGFGDSVLLKNLAGKAIESTHASIAMVELAKKHEGNVSIVMLGPTTNLALAASLDANFVGRVKKLYAMGSSVAGWGNFKANVEYNYGADPEANSILLNLVDASQLTLLPWETAYNARLPKDWRVNVLGRKRSPFISFINEIERHSLTTFDKDYISADACTIATMLWPRIITSSFETYMQAVTDGIARGSVLVEYPRTVNVNHKLANVKIITSIHVELFKKALIRYLTCDTVAC